MKNRKVLNLRTHLGGWLGKTSYDSEQDGCEMELTPAGVLIKKHKNEPIIFKKKPVYILSSNSNNIEALIEAFDDAPETKDAPDAKRGAGRPAKE